MGAKAAPPSSRPFPSSRWQPRRQSGHSARGTLGAEERPRDRGRTGRGGAGPGGAAGVAVTAGVCGSQGVGPAGGCVAMPELAVQKVVVHPLVLLSVVDHFNRIGKVGNQKRVVGVLLGSWQKKVLDVSNSFAVPFDEDDKDDSVWFLDHDYLENMYGMFKKVNARERIVGWYHTGPKLHKNDIAINELMKRYCPNSVLVIIDVKPKDLGLPTEAYISVEEVHDDGTPTSKTFEHVTSEIGAEEAEEVGVEHLLRDIKDTTVGTLSQRITNQVHGLKGLNSKLLDIRGYLEKVATGKLPISHQIIYQLQDVFNLLPDVSLQEFVKAFYLNSSGPWSPCTTSSTTRLPTGMQRRKKGRRKKRAKRIGKMTKRKRKTRKRVT
uniref:26S proteasome non-ATPase regulatory subunit 7 n=1 Tax=Oryctolagus cuniculus TaxID=9986 RepID=G1SVT4_RABIT